MVEERDELDILNRMLAGALQQIGEQETVDDPPVLAALTHLRNMTMRLASGLRAIAPAPAPHDRTIFECRCCDRSIGGKTDGTFDDPAWGRIANIDGPDAICPECQKYPVALDGLREEYPNVALRAKVAPDPAAVAPPPAPPPSGPPGNSTGWTAEEYRVRDECLRRWCWDWQQRAGKAEEELRLLRAAPSPVNARLLEAARVSLAWMGALWSQPPCCDALKAAISAAEAAPTTQAPPVFDARTLLLIRMGRACVDWVTDDPEGSCHLCERDERGEHDEECLFAAYLRTPAEAAEAPPKSERGALERLRVVVRRALRDLRFDQSQYMKGQRDGLTIALTAIEAEPSAIDTAPAPAAGVPSPVPFRVQLTEYLRIPADLSDEEVLGHVAERVERPEPATSPALRAAEAAEKASPLACCATSHRPLDTACRGFNPGANGQCSYCDHEEKCHPGLGATCEIGSGEAAADGAAVGLERLVERIVAARVRDEERQRAREGLGRVRDFIAKRVAHDYLAFCLCESVDAELDAIDAAVKKEAANG